MPDEVSPYHYDEMTQSPPQGCLTTLPRATSRRRRRRKKKKKEEGAEEEEEEEAEQDSEQEQEEEGKEASHFYIYKLPINRPCGRYVI